MSLLCIAVNKLGGIAVRKWGMNFYSLIDEKF